MGGRSGCDRNAIHAITRHCTIKMIFKVKQLHNVALRMTEVHLMSIGLSQQETVLRLLM